MTSPDNDAERAMGLSGWETLDDDEPPPRPVTAVPPSSANGTTAPAAKPSSRAGKKTAPKPLAVDTTSAMDGWGDFDTDRLLRGERRTGALEADDAAVWRENRLEALARHTGRPPPAREPSSKLVVLRQRTLALMELTPAEGLPPDAAAGHSPVKSALKKPLDTHRRRADADHAAGDECSSKLPVIKRGLLAAGSTGPTPRASTRLFGPHIDDSLETRAMVFQRFLPVWSLMSSRGGQGDINGEGNPSLTAPSPTRASSAASGAVAVARDCKTAFECSMVLTKICKAIGIALSASPPPEVWHAPRRRSSSSTALSPSLGPTHAHGDVDLDSFGEFVVRNALQPATHHFRLDRDLTEYLHTIDAVIHALVTRRDDGDVAADHTTRPLTQWRLRELSELQAVLPLWKKGVHFVQKQPPLVKAKAASGGASIETSGGETVAATDPSGESALTAIQSRVPGDVMVIHAPDLSVSHLAKMLPVHEARAVQDANLRCKLQLRQSWQPRVVVADPLPLAGLGRVADASGSPALGSCMRVEAVAVPPPLPPRCASPGRFTRSDNQQLSAEPTVLEPPHEQEPTLLLLCGACPESESREAALWCSACFAVYCATCWTRTHGSTVDTSCVDNQKEPTMLSARPLRTQLSAASLAPPVAIVYLPTKPVARGTLRKGSSSHRAKATNQVDDSASDEDEDEEEDTKEPPHLHLTRALSSHAILPAIKPPRQTKAATRLDKTSKAHRSAPALGETASPPSAPTSAMDSTANLLKALMLGTASSASVVGASSSSSTASPWPAASSSDSQQRKREYKEPARRTKLRTSAITLDAAALFPP